MKMPIRTLVAAVALSAMFAGSAFAMVSPRSLSSEIQSAVNGSGNVNVVVRAGVATISGYVNDHLTKSQVERVARNAPGIDRVINLVTSSN